MDRQKSRGYVEDVIRPQKLYVEERRGRRHTRTHTCYVNELFVWRVMLDQLILNHFEILEDAANQFLIIVLHCLKMFKQNYL